MTRLFPYKHTWGKDKVRVRTTTQGLGLCEFNMILLSLLLRAEATSRRVIRENYRLFGVHAYAHLRVPCVNKVDQIKLITCSCSILPCQGPTGVDFKCYMSRIGVRQVEYFSRVPT